MGKLQSAATAAGLAAGLAGLAGCASHYLPVDGAGHVTAEPAPSTPPPAAKGDTCGADKLQYLVGKPKQQAPVPADLSRQRLDCTTCIHSHLDDPRRVTILFDQASGLITTVKCQ